jgi:hypothetical protein
MNFNHLSLLFKDKRVLQEIDKHLWIESQKAGHNIGADRAAEEWVRLYSAGWTKYNWPEFYTKYVRQDKANRKYR